MNDFFNGLEVNCELTKEEVIALLTTYENSNKLFGENSDMCENIESALEKVLGKDE